MAVYRLKGCVQHYAWGGTQFLPNLLGVDNLKAEPWAEYWLGIHPKGAAKVQWLGGETSLPDFLDHNPEVLHGAAASSFEKLPFLLKILDVRTMLSIQLHPTRERAQVGFLREETLGIPRLAPNRSYKDQNHKPEVMVALTDFWLLHGFRSAAEIEKTLEEIPAWSSLRDTLKRGGVTALYKTVMEAPQERVDEWLGPLYEELYQRDDLREEEVAYWAWQAFEQYTRNGHFDRGIFSIYWFNLVKLKAGEGIFQGAGLPHAYLRGVNVELMANSDNVLRGGLTPKHIDVPELLDNVCTEAVQPLVLKGVSVAEGVQEYPVPVPDFRLLNMQIASGQEIKIKHPKAAIHILLSGQLTIDDETFHAGEAFMLAGEQTTILKNLGVLTTVLYAATF
ncbi:MAG: mannose-6-phosphate isomerase, class I [Bacteroidota bacterium]